MPMKLIISQRRAWGALVPINVRVKLIIHVRIQQMLRNTTLNRGTPDWMDLPIISITRKILTKSSAPWIIVPIITI